LSKTAAHKKSPGGFRIQGQQVGKGHAQMIAGHPETTGKSVLDMAEGKTALKLRDMSRTEA
jgi:hypothetical protein